MCQRAAERPAVAHGRVGDRRGGLGQNAAVLADQRVVDQLIVGGPGPDQQFVAYVRDAAQLIKGAHVDQ